jgi:hypothetical protein
MRGINSEFIETLKSGELAFVLDKALKQPNNYCIEIRENYINLYYRGGSALKITQKSKGYHFKFDDKYCMDSADKTWFKILNQNDPKDWESAMDRIAQQMDKWFEAHPKLERENQQKILTSNRDDFCIIDIEYAIHKKNLNGENGCRLDMLALHLSQTGTKLVLIEYKHGIGAMTGNASLAKHHADLLTITRNDISFDVLEQSVINIWQNKYDLGLIKAEPRSIIGTEVLFLISNHNDRSTKLDSQKALMDKALPAKIFFLLKDDYLIDYDKAEWLV